MVLLGPRKQKGAAKSARLQMSDLYVLPSSLCTNVTVSPCPSGHLLCGQSQVIKTVSNNVLIVSATSLSEDSPRQPWKTYKQEQGLLCDFQSSEWKVSRRKWEGGWESGWRMGGNAERGSNQRASGLCGHFITMLILWSHISEPSQQ